MRRITRLVTALIVSVALVLTAPAAAHAALERSVATDPTVTTDIPGWMKVRVHYTDNGFFGVQVRRFCVKAKAGLTSTADLDVYVTDRWSASTYRFDLGRVSGLLDGTWSCQRASIWQSSKTLKRDWRWKGYANGQWCVALCWTQGSGSASGRMR